MIKDKFFMIKLRTFFEERKVTLESIGSKDNVTILFNYDDAGLPVRQNDITIIQYILQLYHFDFQDLIY